MDRSGPEARLRSVVRPTPWPVGEPLAARCPGATFAHHPPGVGCACGIHAARDVAEAAFHAELPSRAGEPMVVGLAALWGRVVEGEAGWRASLAYPEALVLPVRGPADRGIERLAWDLSAYGAPIEAVDCTRGAVAASIGRLARWSSTGVTVTTP